MKSAAKALLAVWAMAALGLWAAPPQASAANLRPYCTHTLAHLFPEVVERIPGTPYVGTVLALPGKTKQGFGIMLQTKAVPQSCARAGFRLQGRGVGWLAQPRNHKDLYNMGEVFWAKKAGKVQADFRNKASETADDYRCTPGPGKTPVWLELVNRVRDPRGRAVARVEQWHRVPVLNPDRSNAAC